MKDVWKNYSMQLLGLNSDWWGKYHNKLENYYIYRKVEIDGKLVIEEVFSYGKFRQIVDEFFLAAKQAVIRGDAINLGNHIGKVCARRVERDHSNRKINWGKTSLQPKVLNEETGKMVPKRFIYHTGDDYCRIGLHKTGRVRNETVYEFAPAEDNKCKTGFKQEFTAALNHNILLKYRYLYFPLQSERKAELKRETVTYNQQKQVAHDIPVYLD
jgi:hypothetical protein